MRLSGLVCASAAMLGAADSVLAQEVQTYAYDVHGRLINVSRTGGSENSATVYVLDNADNRSSRVTTASPSMTEGSPSDAKVLENRSTRQRAVASAPADPGEPVKPNSSDQ